MSNNRFDPSPVGNTTWSTWAVANTQGAAFDIDYVARFQRTGNTVQWRFDGRVATTIAQPVKVNLPFLWHPAGYTRAPSLIGQAFLHVPGVTRYPMFVGIAEYSAGARNAFDLWYARDLNTQAAALDIGTFIGATGVYETDT